MLSEEEKKKYEEKKAIEIVKGLAVYYGLLDEEEIEENEEVNNSINIVINLIEKQSKEIEELKYKFGVKYMDDILENSISKDKIKAKIEEVEQWELYNMKIPRLSTLDERLGAKIGIKYVLQSLLEKE